MELTAIISQIALLEEMERGDGVAVEDGYNTPAEKARRRHLNEMLTSRFVRCCDSYECWPPCLCSDTPALSHRMPGKIRRAAPPHARSEVPLRQAAKKRNQHQQPHRAVPSRASAPYLVDLRLPSPKRRLVVSPTITLTQGTNAPVKPQREARDRESSRWESACAVRSKVEVSATSRSTKSHKHFLCRRS